MQQFTVPQFIDVEDKIFGPITSRQFVIMLLAAVLIAICYKLCDFSLFIVLGLFIFCASGIVAFLKVNGMAMHYFILNFIQTVKKPALRVWNKSDIINDDVLEKTSVKKPTGDKKNNSVKAFNTSRLSELSLIVDTSGVYEGGVSNNSDESRRMMNEII